MCKKKMGEKEPLEDKSETHGYCEECLEKINARNATGGCICGHGFNRHAEGAGCVSCQCHEYRSAAAQEIEERMVGIL